MAVTAGVVLSNRFPYDAIEKAWLDAEDLGFASGWVYDHFIGMTDVNDPYLEGWTLLAVLLARSKRIRGGNLVLGNSYRHPAVLAKMAAALDIASSGRLDIGLGAGWYEAEYDAYGIPFPKIGARMEALDEALQVMKTLFTRDRANFNGQYYTITDSPFEPKSLQQPHPPLWVGGAGEKYLLRIAGERADGWNVWQIPVEDYRRKAGILAGFAEAAGRDPAAIRRSIGISLAIAPTEAAVKSALERRAGDRESENVIAGTPEQVAGHLRPYVEAGVQTFLIEGLAPFDREMLALFIQEVVPALG